MFTAGDIIQKIFRKFPLLPLNLAQEPCSNATYLLENGWSCSLELAISARVEFNTVLKSCVHQVFVRFLSLRGTQKLWHIFPTSPCQWHLFSHFYPLPVSQLHIGLYISGKDIKVYKINTSKVPFAQLKKSCRLPFTAPCFYLFIYLILNSKAALFFWQWCEPVKASEATFLLIWNPLLNHILQDISHPFSGHQTPFVSVTKHFLFLHAPICICLH